MTRAEWLEQAREISKTVQLNDLEQCAKLKIWFDAGLNMIEHCDKVHGAFFRELNREGILT